jgi:hypothetical protein
MYSWIDYMIDSPQSPQISLSSLSQVTSEAALPERQAACYVAEEGVFLFSRH